MKDLIKFLDIHNIPYSTQQNKHGNTVVDVSTFEILEEGSDFCVAATRTMNFMWMSLEEIKEWLLSFV